MHNLSLGIDIGGTFTDIVIYNPNSERISIQKELTTSGDLAVGVIAGVRKLLERESIAPENIGRVVHATTVFTNALIERKGARMGLITTEGFRDVLEIGRERKYELYDIFIQMPAPLVPRYLRREVPERLSETGAVEVPLDEKALMSEVDDLVALAVESLAIIFLHSYANPVHERRAVELIASQYPHLAVTASCDVAPEIREYERSSTTAANAYIKPLARRYLEHLASQLRALQVNSPLLLMLSNGGLTDLEEAKRSPIRLLESGPAAGAFAGAFFGKQCGHLDVLAFDMGGTTAKLSLVDEGEPLIAYSFEAAREKRFMEGSGLPLKISSIELIEIGAGGGSIAYIDNLGLLKVGPESSGSEPGPACYGRGGSHSTVTDADLLLGYLNADFFLGGSMPIHKEAARRTVASLARRAGLSLQDTAWGIHNVVNENMAAAALVHVSERGKDLKKYALLATGGAAPVHAYHVAKKLTLKKLICPPAAGVGSAVGLLMAPARIDRVASLLRRLQDLNWEAFENLFLQLQEDAVQVLARTGASLDQLNVLRLADMRYVGQGSEIVVHLPAGPYVCSSRLAITTAFEETYRELFSRIPPNVAIEVVNVRVSVSAPVAGLKIILPAKGKEGVGARKGKRPVYFPEEGCFIDTIVYNRYLVPPGEIIAGPAVFEENESTLVIGPGSVCQCEPDGSLIVTLPEEGGN
jgi:N-methylhydantoinase A